MAKSPPVSASVHGAPSEAHKPSRWCPSIYCFRMLAKYRRIERRFLSLSVNFTPCHAPRDRVWWRSNLRLPGRAEELLPQDRRGKVPWSRGDSPSALAFAESFFFGRPQLGAAKSRGGPSSCWDQWVRRSLCSFSLGFAANPSERAHLPLL